MSPDLPILGHLWKSALCVSIFIGLMPLDGRAATLGFNTIQGKTYIVESGTDLHGWTALTIPWVGDGTRHLESVPENNGGLFYRVRVTSRFDFEQITVRPKADIGDLKASYDITTWRSTALEILQRVCPDAAWLVNADADPGFFQFWFNGDPKDFTQLLLSLSTAVHETIHHVGFKRLGFEAGGLVYHLALGSDRFFAVRDLKLFPRSEILDRLPPRLRTSGYVTTYLVGQSGAQDLRTLLDELNAYTFSSIIDASLIREMNGIASISSRDGLLTFMLYAETYLKTARDSHPADYQKILASNLPDLIVLLWDRAERTLMLSEGDPRLGQDDAAIRSSVYDSDNLAEIDRLRALVVPKLEIGMGR